LHHVGNGLKRVIELDDRGQRLERVAAGSHLRAQGFLQAPEQRKLALCYVENFCNEALPGGQMPTLGICFVS
jgi:hypothetical protein